MGRNEKLIQKDVKLTTGIFWLVMGVSSDRDGMVVEPYPCKQSLRLSQAFPVKA